MLEALMCSLIYMSLIYCFILDGVVVLGYVPSNEY